jgi:hypothetical protein
MPGGNPYTRPANRPEREAMKRQSARKAALDNIDRRLEENISSVNSADEFIRDLDSLSAMKSRIRNSDAYAADDATIAGGKAKENDRKANRYKYANGGCVIAGRGGKYKGAF